MQRYIMEGVGIRILFETLEIDMSSMDEDTKLRFVDDLHRDTLYR